MASWGAAYVHAALSIRAGLADANDCARLEIELDERLDTAHQHGEADLELRSARRRPSLYPRTCTTS